MTSFSSSRTESAITPGKAGLVTRHHVGLRLSIAFGLLIAILICVGWLGLSRLGQINGNLRQIVDERWAKLQLTREALRESNDNHRITMQIFMLEDSERIKPLLARRAVNTARVSVIAKQLEDRAESPEETNLLKAVTVARTPYVDAYEDALALLINEHKYTESRAMMVQNVLPLLNEYHNAWNNFAQFQGDQMDQAARNSAQQYALVRRLFVIWISLAVGLALAIALYVTRSMVVEIRMRKTAEQEIHVLNQVLELRIVERTHELALTNLDLSNQIAERTRAEQTVRQSEARTRAIIDRAFDAFIGMDSRGVITDWNSRAETAFGWTASEVIGQDLVSRIVPSKYRVACTSALQDFLRNGESPILNSLVEVPLLHSDGTEFPAELAITPIRLGDEFIFAAFLHDITTRKETERAQQNAIDAAETANRLKSQFLANMSHEIRTPMNGILGMTELVLDTELSEEQRDNLGLVRLSAESLLSILNDILDFSKVEAGKLEFEPMPFDLRESLGDAMQTLNFRAHQKGLELIYDVHPNVPEAVIGDPGRLRQILVNLVGNAIKFTERGEVLVTVSQESEEPRFVVLHFSVADTGIGIPLDKQEHIFEAFSQADGSMTRRFGGTGLGLSISTRLVEMMDGRIWVVSDSANGSTFHFTVRLELQAKVPERKQLIDASQLRNVSVLVVDDNFTNRKVLEGMLSRWGIISTCVDGGRAGLEEIARAGDAGHPFHLVIVDGQMPDMDGFAFVEQIQSRSMGGSITIMMLTSAGHLGDAARCRELGISAYLVKPVRQTELLESICRVLQNSPQTTKPDLVTRHTVREDQHRLKILLAEDNLVNQTLAVRLLEKRGYTVTVTSNGRQAVELFDRQSFDLVLMDVQMPEMDGFAATAAIRGIEKLRGTHVPIIAMTAHALKGDQQRCLAAGMDNYISKPIRTGEFFAMIEDLAGRYKVGSVNTAGEDPHHLLKVLE